MNARRYFWPGCHRMEPYASYYPNAGLLLPETEEVAARLLALQKGIAGAKWRPRENLHLTLRFFGEVQEPIAEEIDAELADVASRHPPFELQLKASGTFGGVSASTTLVGVRRSGENHPAV